MNAHNDKKVAFVLLWIVLSTAGLFCTFPSLIPPTPIPSPYPIPAFPLTGTPDVAITMPIPTIGSPTDPIPIRTPVRNNDESNDAVDCRTGSTRREALPPEIDIGSAWVEISTQNQDEVVFVVVFPRVSDLAQMLMSGEINFLGGFELYDPGEPLLAIRDDEWYFNNTGNRSVNYGWNREFGQLFAWAAVLESGNWQVVEGIFFEIVIQGNMLKIIVPRDQLPSGDYWMVSTTNFTVCDVLGLRDELPSFPMPDY
jgi:hypothetical protein